MTASLSILLLALAQVETGSPRHPNGDDHAVGRKPYCEVSAFQVLPGQWAGYARIGEHPWVRKDAERVVTAMIKGFPAYAKRTPADLYAYYHRPALYIQHGYRVDRLPPRVRARCLRYQNLVLDLEREQRK